MSALAEADAPAVEVRDLRVELSASGVDVVDEIQIEIRAGEVLGLVGESGCGKTTIGMALLGHCRSGGRVAGGAVLVDGRDIAELGEGDLRRMRGGTVSYIPQDPGTALNPALRIGTQLMEILEAAARRSARSARAKRSRRWRSPRTTSSCAAIRTSSPAASSSASRSRWPSPTAPT